MRFRFLASWGLVVCFLIAGIPLVAHHGGVNYDTSKAVVLKGAVVTKWQWWNPHVILMVDFKNDKGEVEHWVAETTNPAMLNRVGWSKDTLKPGDQVTLWVNPNKVGAKITFLQKITLADGKELSTAKAF